MSFRITPPTSRSAKAARAWSRLSVNRPACRPNSESFTAASASSQRSKGSTVTTGPKTSAQLTLAPRGAFAITVGGITAPWRGPPRGVWGPPARAAAPADEDLGPARARLLDPGLDAARRRLVDERAHEHLGVGGVAD